MVKHAFITGDENAGQFEKVKEMGRDIDAYG